MATRVKSAMSKRARIFSGSYGKRGLLVAGRKRQELRAQIYHDSGADIAQASKAIQSAVDMLKPDKPLGVVDDEWEDECTYDTAMQIDDILSGRETMNISHAGGELQELFENLKEERNIKRIDYRKRQDRLTRRTKAFQMQMSQMADAFLEWKSTYNLASMPMQRASEQSPQNNIQSVFRLQVVDIYASYTYDVPLCKGDSSIAVSVVRSGLVPCSPYKPTVALTVQVLELFRCCSLRCPRMSLQAFSKMLCDLHNVPYRSYLTKQLTICVDIYLEILDEVDARIQHMLLRDSPMWRLTHACPTCTHKVQNEPKLHFDMLFTMDGNDSLKRIDRSSQKLETDEGEVDIETFLSSRTELPDDRQVRGDYYLSRAQVETWTHQKGPILASEDSGERSPCTDRWKNMSDQATSRAWSIFDETGIFVAVCRHGFVLTIADMVKSGEGSQYALAIVENLLKAFGPNLGGGYDIGCRFKTTLANSELGPEATRLNYTLLVGAFHGHAHNRLCQLSHLTTYVQGLGLSDLEGCERLFSKSNDLASSVRHASIFHRRQRIVQYFHHLDVTDTYQHLSDNLVNGYINAQKIISGEPTLHDSMRELGIANVNVFQEWLQEEQAYLRSLTKEPESDIYEIEYLQRLINLQALETRLEAARAAWNVLTPEVLSKGLRDYTRSIETERRSALELRDKTLIIVQDLEARLQIQKRWQEGDANWIRVKDLLTKRQYRRCLDRLEELIICRMFELAKMNQSGTGYRMRQHIGKALKTRSQAIRNALDRYNEAALALRPPRATLKWEEVVEYTFLSEFDILSETREDIRLRPWAHPAARRIMDMHFKIQRAREEIIRLDVEIKRLITFIHDEEHFLADAADKLQQNQPYLAHEIRIRLTRLHSFNVIHQDRLRKLLTHPGFKASTLEPGITLTPPTLLADNHAMDAGPCAPETDINIEDEEITDDEIFDEDGTEEKVQEILKDVDFMAQVADL